jgi:hypothetical protein
MRPAAFGVEPITVKRCMKLASVSPKWLAQHHWPVSPRLR